MATVYKRGGKKNRGGSYYIQWYDHTGKRRTKCAKTTDKAAAERIAAKLEADAALRRDGVIDPTLDTIAKESQRTVESHLADFEAKLRTADRSDQYVRETTKYIAELAEACEFHTAADINADKVIRYAYGIQESGKSARTVQARLAAAKGFTKWLTSEDKLSRDPLASVKKPNPSSDRRHERRMLLPDEWLWLVDVTIHATERHRMIGSERLLLYRTAIQTGLRSNELRSLTRGRLFLDSDPPYVTCKGRSTKNGKDARQYIQTELAEELRSHIRTKSPKAPVFSLPHETNLARMLRKDLAEARRAWLKESKDNPGEYLRREQSDFLAATNHDGELVDFHSLRHTCGAWLAMTGAHPKVVQQVMRHSTITLTMDTYGHIFPGAEADAVQRVGEMLARPPLEFLEATGTDNRAPDSALHYAQQPGRDSSQTGATVCERPDVLTLAKSDSEAGQRPKCSAKLRDSGRLAASACDGRMSPLAPLAQLAEQLTLNQ